MALGAKKVADVRPTIEDIERISKGQAAKRRGTGSRAVPHRLNNAERKEWELAKTRRFLQLRGSGWRKERGDSPLANIYRNYCDAVNIPCISVLRAIGTSEPLVDTVIVDFSPLRRVDVSDYATQCIREAQNQNSLQSSQSYGSISTIDDHSDVIGMLGWDGIEKMFESDPIW
eukprot:CAMPEP_0174953828 /NCGR_PEP_ID=MMETSP0004_2-20121128/76_1 /TAXON_ID=420556 /ORGANISM="Ochromonas sp., Strain CCMP1393" /LENGTH=172 /DNA_ID=CAMNT_0016201555 /DNA_START=130 /DNA_END=645 /DNA_ORIENTATION=+